MARPESDLNTIRDFDAGNRVEIAPHLDRWMRGDRYGVVIYVGRSLVEVAMDRSGKNVKYDPSDLRHVI